MIKTNAQPLLVLLMVAALSSEAQAALTKNELEAQSKTLETQTNALVPMYNQGVYKRKGSKGVSGPKGIQGPIGAMGPQGPVGPTGPAGPAGPTGVAGPIGDQGAPGGPRGTLGDAGPKGPVGVKGPQGNQGPVGNTGPVGPTGYVGAMGPQGAYGPAGAAGAVGDSGYNAVTPPTTFCDCERDVDDFQMLKNLVRQDGSTAQIAMTWFLSSELGGADFARAACQTALIYYCK